MKKTCKVCGKPFEAAGRSLYCGDVCRKVADAKRKRDWRQLETHVARNLDDYAEGIEHYRETRGESRYATADDMAAEANSEGVTRLPFVNDDQRLRTFTAPTAIGGRLMVRVRGRDWGLTRAGCLRLVNGLAAEKGHCPACDRLLTDRPVDLRRHNMSLVMDYSAVTGDPFGQSGDNWLPEAVSEDGSFDPTEARRTLTRGDVDGIGEQHRAGCACAECRAERAA